MKEFAQFRLDAANQRLWRHLDAGTIEPVLLAPKAFAVLKHLVEHAGRLATRDELLDAAWPGTHVEPAVLKNQILDIRNALGDCPHSPIFIETLPRLGYRFIAPVRESVNDANLESVSGKLAGRHAAFRELRACLRKTFNNQRQIVFITGELGIGKTALADEFQRRLAADIPGVHIARGQCVEGYGSKEAYYPILEAMGQLCRTSEGGWVVKTLAAQAPTCLAQLPSFLKPELREMLRNEIQGATRERMLRELCDVLHAIASAGPLLLVLEDLHWVDPFTVDLISALARCREPAELMLLGTYRPADVESSNHPLKALTEDLLVHRLCREITLERLTEAEITEYLTDEAPEIRPPEALAKIVYLHSKGNPLFMVDALEHLKERGVISRKQGDRGLQVPPEEIALRMTKSLPEM